MIKKLLFSFLLSLTSTLGIAQTWIQSQPEIERDTWSLDMSGQFAIVGNFRDDFDENGNYNLNSAGAAFIYELSANNIWVFRQKLVASDRGIGDNFGRSVAISSDGYAVIGTRNDQSAYVFEYDGSRWVEKQKLAAPSFDPVDLFGWSVAIFKNKIIVGAPNAGENNSVGAAYLFHRNEASSSWVFVEELLPATSDSKSFGASVDISETFIVAGAPNSDGDLGINSGAVFVYSAADGSFQSQLNFPFLQPLDEFGSTVAISGSTIIVGIPEHALDDSGSDDVDALSDGLLNPGIVGIFSGASWQLQKVVSPDRRPNGQFGFSVDIWNDLAIVGADQEGFDSNGENFMGFAGTAYILERNAGGWGFQDKISSNERMAFDSFGTKVAIDNSNALIFGDENMYAFRGCSADDVPEISADKQIICVGDSVLLSIEGELGDDLDWYDDECNGNLIKTSSSIIVAPKTTTTYFVKNNASCTPESGCASIQITVLPAINLQALATPEINGTDASITLTVTGGSPPFSYDWDTDERQDFDDSKDLTSIINGSYNIVVRDNLGCKDSLDILVSSSAVTSLEKTNLKNEVSVYPNPNKSGKVIVRIDENSPAHLNILDIHGQLLESHFLFESKTTLDLTHLPQGLYLLEFNTSKEKLTSRLTKF